MEMSQTMAGHKDKFLHPNTALQYLADNRCLERDMCYDPDSETVAKLLRSYVCVSYVLCTLVNW